MAKCRWLLAFAFHVRREKHFTDTNILQILICEEGFLYEYCRET